MRAAANGHRQKARDLRPGQDGRALRGLWANDTFVSWRALVAERQWAYGLTMPTSVERVLKDALELSSEARLRLVDLLVESLDETALSAIDRRWIAEAQRRHAEIASGGVEVIPGESALTEVRESLRR